MAFDPLAGDVVRASTWSEFIGQEKLKDRLDKHIQAALMDGHAPGHILLTGDPGFGKTSLAGIIAKRCGVPLEVLVMPVPLATIVSRLVVEQFDGVLLLDEIHRASVKDQEELLTLIESNYLQYRSERYMVGWLMVVAATTDRKKIIAPLRDRFEWIPDIDAYSDKEIGQILLSMVKKLGLDLPESEAFTLAKACGGTPRRARSFALTIKKLNLLNDEVPNATQVLDFLRIDENGLSVGHWRYLDALHRLGGQAGIKPLSSYLNESEAVLEDLEKMLLDQGLIDYTDRGRALKTAGFQRIRNRKVP